MASRNAEHAELSDGESCRVNPPLGLFILSSVNFFYRLRLPTCHAVWLYTGSLKGQNVLRCCKVFKLYLSNRKKECSTGGSSLEWARLLPILLQAAHKMITRAGTSAITFVASISKSPPVMLDPIPRVPRQSIVVSSNQCTLCSLSISLFLDSRKQFARRVSLRESHQMSRWLDDNFSDRLAAGALLSFGGSLA